MTETTLVELRDFRVRFGAAVAVQDVSLTLRRGETLALVGESGSGKSLTALGIAGLSPPAALLSGSLRIEGREMLGAPERDWRRLRGARIGMVFQDAMGSLNPAMRIGTQIAEVMEAHLRLPRTEVARRVLEALEEVGLPNPRDKAAAFPHQLSGGQQQRVMIAMALAADPALLIADEPTTALDATVQAQILALLVALQARRGLAMLFVSHDLAVVEGIAQRVAVMQHGRIVEEGPTARVFAAPTHAYTAALLASRPGPVAPAVAGDAAAVPALEVRDLAVVFRAHRLGGVPLRAVDGVSLRIAPGEALGLVGESGSGKSTLARTAVGLAVPAAGSIRVFGRDPMTGERRAMARTVQMVFQDAAGSLNPRLTIAAILAEPLAVHALCPMDQRRHHAARLLEEVGLPAAHLDRYPHQLSGGQRQRVAIARALAVNPRLLVCDEPVSALDMTVQAQVLDLLARIRRERGLALLFIGHDLEAVGAVSDRIAVMKDGRVVEIGTAEAVLRRPVTAYAQALVAAMPRRLARGGDAAATRPAPASEGAHARAPAAAGM
ncbi:ABC transporter ATP-binding protein [Roseomonas frigidaquae]|uniref:ABC transporter ATP-binding protein n=1 Tax=Falsiroseomonas frigidaquae TaxID=487318 RepID=A0ABX1EUX6_9PROT|nr:ABC transporter ATP-binding protein [Falsiroseomonas frigidaquae]NKE43857.1 ABC transporter ATP-binding protein [Falsiroseomonas frigidaquae]